MKNISKQTMIEKFAKFSLNKIELNQIRGGEIPPEDDLPLPKPVKPVPPTKSKYGNDDDDRQF